MEQLTREQTLEYLNKLQAIQLKNFGKRIRIEVKTDTEHTRAIVTVSMWKEALNMHCLCKVMAEGRPVKWAEESFSEITKFIKSVGGLV